MYDDLNVFSWNDISKIAQIIAKKIQKDFSVDLIVGVSRGGVVFATLLSELLQCDLNTICITRREKGMQIHPTPQVKYTINEEYIHGKNILLVDEILVTGETLEISKNELIKQGANVVKTCAIINRSNGLYKSDFVYCYKEKDNSIFPWDYLVLSVEGDVLVHPEYKEMNSLLEADLYE